MEQGFNFFEQNAKQAEELVTLEKVAVISEDFRDESGHDFSKTFIQAEFGDEWELKLLPNIESTTGSIQDNIANRQIYKNLPDLKRAGKRFRYIANPNVNEDKVLQEVFFPLNKLKKEGDELASAIIKEFLSAPSEGCVVAQVISAPPTKQDKVGQVLLLPFTNSGDNAHIATLINNKLNPKGKREKRINVFDLLLSPSLYLNCEKKVFDKKEGRSFATSTFSSSDVSPLIEVNGELVHFTKDDLNWVEKQIKKEDNTIEVIQVATGFKDEKFVEGFNKLLKSLENPDISMHNHFQYKAPKDPRNSEETEKYIVENFEKMEMAVKLIKGAKSVDEILQEIGSDSSTEGADGETISGEKAGDLLASSTAGLLEGSALNQTATPTTTTETKPTESTTQPADVNGIDFGSALNG